MRRWTSRLLVALCGLIVLAAIVLVDASYEDQAHQSPRLARFVPLLSESIEPSRGFVTTQLAVSVRVIGAAREGEPLSASSA